MVRASIVVATYNRPERLARLLRALARQTVPHEDYEVVVVDDGSTLDVTPLVEAYAGPLQLTVLRQDNAGVAVARQRGVERAAGRIVIFLDDDMLVCEDFVARHLAEHEGHADRVVMGELLADPAIGKMPLFERYHAYQLKKAADRYARTGTFAGHDVYTGNLSMPRDLFIRAGGFDPTFFIEDVELGVRLEALGAKFVFTRRAATVHASDHTSLDKWLARSTREGRDWVRLTRKHPCARDASPWRFLDRASPLSRPFFMAAVLAPGAVPAMSHAVYEGAARGDAIGLRRATLSAMTLLYGLQYFRGVREECASLRGALDDYRTYARAARA